jgi:hypothetical protein
MNVWVFFVVSQFERDECIVINVSAFTIANIYSESTKFDVIVTFLSIFSTITPFLSLNCDNDVN